MMKVKFRLIEYGSPAWKKAVQLREEILRKPLGSAFTDEELEEEKTHYQVAGYVDDNLIATAVLVPEKHQMKMQRVVVVENLRNANIGSQMMAYCEDLAKIKKLETLYCHARDSAVNFYLKNGYKKIGGYFNEDGIPHLKMQKNCS